MSQALPNPMEAALAAELPKLRQDLIIREGDAGWLGEPTWLIEDGLRNRFFRIGQSAFQLLRHWQQIPMASFLQQASLALGRDVNYEEAAQLAGFLKGNGLVESLDEKEQQALSNRNENSLSSITIRLLKTYLFFRIPLTKPQRFLDSSWPYVSYLFTTGFVWVWAVTTVLAMVLLTRQWDGFMATFSSFLTLEGLVLYGASLILIKAIHELGHAYMAHKFGVEVPVIGVAFMLLFPILYTDTTAAWRLSGRTKRLLIDLGGIFAELVLASFATALWLFLPDGNLKAIAFTTATLSWALSLLVNLNPFMRFDGYYILSDFLGLENLQERGFALAKWKLRNLLFGLQLPPPEMLPVQLRRFVIAHAFGTWIYRFFLFLGIALIVYYFAFKVLGLALFIVEIVWFIALPVSKEILTWWKMRKQFSYNRRTITNLILLLGLSLAFFAPLDTRVELGAIRQSDMAVQIVAAEPGILQNRLPKRRASIEAGQLLAVMSSPQLSNEITIAKQQVEILKTRLARIHADPEERSLLPVLRSELAATDKRYQSLLEKQNSMNLIAPISGVITDLDEDLKIGQWIAVGEPLARVVDPDGVKFSALADEDSILRIEKNAKGRFIPDDPGLATDFIIVKTISEVASTGNLLDYLQDKVGGPIPVTTNEHGDLEAVGAWYRVESRALSQAKDGNTENALVRGTIILEAKPQSLASRMFKQIAAVLVRESGF